MTIDLNCDMGEGLDNDALLMPYISSANIACGYHAGDEKIMLHTIELALSNNVSIGAHPGFNDKINFGRTEMQLPLQQVYDLVTEQLHIITKIAVGAGARIKHIKPHGALYNMSAKDPALANTIARAVYDTDNTLVLFGLSGSHSLTEAKALGLGAVAEVFADRTYQDDGSLTPRNKANAMITNEDASAKQVLQMISSKTVTAISGNKVSIQAETICIHGDGGHAVVFAKHIYQTLQKNSIGIKSI
jgi:UPF0271 protein